MLKTKSLIIYLFCMTLAILLFSSFDAEFFFGHTSRLNLSDEMMYQAYTSNIQSDETTPYDTDNTDDTGSDRAKSYDINDTSAYIRHYKYILYYLDYHDYPEEDTDLFDVAMQSAVLTYQQAKGIDVTGVLNTKTMDALENEKIEYKEGKQGSIILEYQQILKSLGYISDQTEINGTFGEDTTAAVRAYQLNNEIEITGTINYETQQALERPASEQVSAD